MDSHNESMNYRIESGLPTAHFPGNLDDFGIYICGKAINALEGRDREQVL